MTSVWVESLGLTCQRALDFMEAAVRDCTDELWRTSMWEVPSPDAGEEVRGPGGALVADLAARRALVQRHSTPWAVAWHALERLDFILTGGFVAWDVWPPLAKLIAEGRAAAHEAAPGVTGHTGLDVVTMQTPWTRSELLDYIGYCRQRVADVLDEITDERAATRLGRRAEPYVARIMDKAGHVIEHGSQIRQFITAGGVSSSP